MKGQSQGIRRTAAAVVFVLFCSSCGGPYTARKVNLPDRKLSIAGDLFSRGKYGDAAVEYKDFIARFAGDERSDYAQFRLAESYRMDGEYALAAVEYRILINDYGYSEYIDDAFFLEGLCAFRQAQRAERDQAKTYEALSRINRFLQLFKNSPRRAEAETVLMEIYDRLGKKDFLNAYLYYRRKEYNASRIYFEKVAGNYPGTSWSGRSHYYLGAILEREGDTGGAVREYEEAALHKGDFKEKRKAEERLRSLPREEGLER